MSKLKKCKSCKTYTLKDICDKCKSPTTNAHYKFVRIRDVKKSK
ncbi:MAG: nucleolar RNA-binding Nop10p family protein [Nanoarchaeota archaeon]|nr:DNA-directed RNA polymerase subunit E [Nanoarchaeota archaeon]